jgi:hypothetical protein
LPLMARWRSMAPRLLSDGRHTAQGFYTALPDMQVFMS